MHTHQNNKTDFLSTFESLISNSFGLIQKIKLLHENIHEQYFILSWICYIVCHNEWYKKSLKSLFILTIAVGIARSPRLGIFGSNLISDKTENEILSLRTL
jgi:hypothetical protein